MATPDQIRESIKRVARQVNFRAAVHITDQSGKLLYDRLWDDGSNVLTFDSGHGFIDRLDIRRDKLTIVSGWAKESV